MSVRNITLSGFRGVRESFVLDLTKGGNPASVVLYGANGTGKSSLTDAWEWMQAQKIQHLAREGAQEAAYANKGARKGTTFVSIEFKDATLGTIRRELSADKPKADRVIGALAELRRRAPHPCQIRFTDLTAFVGMKKAERYDALANLMGFTPQVAYMKSLRAVQNRLATELETTKASASQQSSALLDATGAGKLDRRAIVDSLKPLFEHYDVAAPESPAECEVAVEALKKQLTENRSSLEVIQMKAMGNALTTIKTSDAGIEAIDSYVLEIENSLRKIDTSSDALRIKLYEIGLQIVEMENDELVCPLCHEVYHGSLLQEILASREALKSVARWIENAERLRQAAADLIQTPGDWPLEQIEMRALNATVAESVENFRTTWEDYCASLDVMRHTLDAAPEQISLEQCVTLRGLLNSHRSLAEVFDARRASVLESIRFATVRRVVHQGERDAAMDLERAVRIRDSWKSASRLTASTRRLEQTSLAFEKLVDAYVDRCLTDVSGRFEEISATVADFFQTLERDSPQLGKPRIRLPQDQDRAVILEVGFDGDVISPAYKYLSESQLNSFGLSVFLACVKRFNQSFRFMILDDVVNSLDGHKRPKLIEILKGSFADFQILLMTHDATWRTRVQSACPEWKAVEFKRHEIAIGPVVVETKKPKDHVLQLLDDGDVLAAGQHLGRIVEGDLQDLAESLRAPVAYRRRGDQTLENLLDASISRTREKLTDAHPLVQRLRAFKSDSLFRNYFAHPKEQEIDWTGPEIREIAERWSVIAQSVRCSRPSCGGVVSIVEEKRMACACGEVELKKPSPTA